MPPDIAHAYAAVLKAPPKPAPVYEPRWTVWGGAYGGSNRTSGDIAFIGSHDLAAPKPPSLDSARASTPCPSWSRPIYAVCLLTT